MTTRRVSRVRDMLREEVARLLLYKIKDPRLSSVSVTRVSLTPDLKRAVVYYSLFDDNVDRKEVQSGLEKASGFFRREFGRKASLKFVPKIDFKFDRSLEYAQDMDRLLSRLCRESETKDDDQTK
ncbi:MAG: 30S ribosome-binding factor RbfA [Thermodesulfobacteriota bacterium]|nr:30S ribosome-binding factor RbfA [Thermodesulfobacteriota bacterium]